MDAFCINDFLLVDLDEKVRIGKTIILRETGRLVGDVTDVAEWRSG